MTDELQTKPAAALRECPECRYALTGLPADHRCPECGFEYDGRMQVHRRPPSLLRNVLIVIVLVAAVRIVIVIVFGSTGGLLLPVLLLLIGGGILMRSRGAYRRDYIAISPVRVVWRYRRERADVHWSAVKNIWWSEMEGRLMFDLDGARQVSVPSALIHPQKPYEHMHAMIARWREQRPPAGDESAGADSR